MRQIRPARIKPKYTSRLLLPTTDPASRINDYGAKVTLTPSTRVLALPPGSSMSAYRKWLDASSTVSTSGVVLQRFLRPISPASNQMKVWIDGAGLKIKGHRLYNGHVVGTRDISATVRYTLLSTDWNPMTVTHATMPVAAVDDPYVEVSAVDQDMADWSTSTKSMVYSGDPGTQSALSQSVFTQAAEFTGMQDKLYYGVKAQIVAFNSGTFVQPPAPFAVGDTYVAESSDYITDDPECFDVCGDCDDMVGQTSSGTYQGYTYESECISNDGCSTECEEYQDEWEQTYYRIYKVCSYTWRITAVTAPTIGNLTEVRGMGHCRMLTDQDFEELEIVSRSRTSNKATITFSTAHGLEKYAGVPVVGGATWSQQPSAWSVASNVGGEPTPHIELHDFDLTLVSSQWSGARTKITLSGAHGMSNGDTVYIRNARFINDTYQNGTWTVYAAAGDSFEISGHFGPDGSVYVQSGTAFTQKFLPASGAFSGFEVVDATSVKYDNTGANAATAACSGVLRIW